MASVEQIIATSTSFLLKSPPGEFKEVLNDIRRLISDERLLNNTIGPTCRAYNTDQMVAVVPVHSSYAVLITKQGETGDGGYLDPRGNQVLIFDHITQKVTGTRPASSNELDRDAEPFRKAFDAAAQEYVKEHYLNGATTVYSRKTADGKILISINISSWKFNAQNFWNGRWRAVWNCKFSPSNPRIELEGSVKVDVHYFEEGNVQLNTDLSRNVSTNADSTRPESLAAAAIHAILEQEAGYQGSLDENYHAMDSTTFKALRRVLPITRNKVDWEKVAQYKLGVAVTEYTKD